MVSLHLLFIFFILFFGIIGASRGAAREIVVIFSVILALFIATLIEKRIPVISDIVKNSDNKSIVLWLRIFVLIPMAYFGYMPPKIPNLNPKQSLASNDALEKIFGLIMGCINGYLIFGTLWYYIHVAGYPFGGIIAPPPGSDVAVWIDKWFSLLPPNFLGEPAIYFAVAIVFTIVIAVFI